MMAWHEKLVKKVPHRYIKIVITGKYLFLLALGSLLSVYLLQYAYVFMITGILVTAIYMERAFANHVHNKKTGYGLHIFGYIGMALLLFFLGIQFPSLPYNEIILVAGILLTLPGVYFILKK